MGGRGVCRVSLVSDAWQKFQELVELLYGEAGDPDGVAVVDGRARIVHADAGFRRALGRGAIELDGPDRLGGSLAAAKPFGAGARAVVRLERADRGLAVATVEPAGAVVESPPLPSDARIVRVYGAPWPRAPDHAALVAAYGLTSAEARVAAALMSGETVRELATRHAVSIDTARTHLKRILEKTATSRQVELVWLLRRGPAAGRSIEPAGSISC